MKPEIKALEMNLYLFVCFLVISCLFLMSSAEEEENQQQSGRRGLDQVVNDVGGMVKGVGKLGTGIIDGLSRSVLGGGGEGGAGFLG